VTVTNGLLNLNIVKLADLIDYPSGNSERVNTKIHIHCYHGQELFSKNMFRDNKYANLSVDLSKHQEINYYCLNIALESRNLTSQQLSEQLMVEINKKN
jgi:hypothetical protein